MLFRPASLTDYNCMTTDLSVSLSLTHLANLTGFSLLQFIDLCILLGCDYCESIKGIGPKKAIEMIKKHKSIEKVIENIDKTVSYLNIA